MKVTIYGRSFYLFTETTLTFRDLVKLWFEVNCAIISIYNTHYCDKYEKNIQIQMCNVNDIYGITLHRFVSCYISRG